MGIGTLINHVTDGNCEKYKQEYVVDAGDNRK